ncbi:MAG: hypothetical protein IPK19_07610 [Chloroflexi bacterium]|nr:hypothetical protein [Chloroflexota bacterium]
MSASGNRTPVYISTMLSIVALLLGALARLNSSERAQHRMGRPARKAEAQRIGVLPQQTAFLRHGARHRLPAASLLILITAMKRFRSLPPKTLGAGRGFGLRIQISGFPRHRHSSVFRDVPFFTGHSFDLE